MSSIFRIPYIITEVTLEAFQPYLKRKESRQSSGKVRVVDKYKGKGVDKV